MILGALRESYSWNMRSHVFSARMTSFARRTISGLIIVILGALWELFSWNMRCVIAFSEHD